MPPLTRLLQGKWAPFRAQRFLTPESIFYLYKSTIRPCMEYCSHIWGGDPRSHGFDLLDRVHKQVVRLVGSGLSSPMCRTKFYQSCFIPRTAVVRKEIYLKYILNLTDSLFRFASINEQFLKYYGHPPKFYARAPGRVNIIGISFYLF